MDVSVLLAQENREDKYSEGFKKKKNTVRNRLSYLCQVSLSYLHMSMVEWSIRVTRKLACPKSFCSRMGEIFSVVALCCWLVFFAMVLHCNIMYVLATCTLLTRADKT